MAISLKHQVVGCCCMAFPCNTKYEGAVDPGSLQVQDQPGDLAGRMCVSHAALQWQGENYRSSHLLSSLGRTALHPEKQNTSLP